MSPTASDVITLITCGGSWERNPREPNGGNYTHRIVVRAELARPVAAAAAG
jgi:sortase (surface protein transpeptidase)